MTYPDSKTLGNRKCSTRGKAELQNTSDSKSTSDSYRNIYVTVTPLTKASKFEIQIAVNSGTNRKKNVSISRCSTQNNQQLITTHR